MINQILRLLLYFVSNNNSICAFQNSLIFLETDNLESQGNYFQVVNVWKMSKYGVFSGPYFPRENSVFGHFSHSVLQ